MKSISGGALLVLCLIITAGEIRAQQVKNQFQLGAELAIPGEEYNPGWGAQFKWLRRLGPSGQLTLSAGYARFRTDKPPDAQRSTAYIVPFLAGYRHNFKPLFIEAQIGYGDLGGKIDIGGDYARPSAGVFCLGAAGGLGLKRFDIGLRFLVAHGNGGSLVGMWSERSFHYTGIFVAYNLRKALH